MFSCNLFCVIQTFTSATHDYILLIRERRCSRGTVPHVAIIGKFTMGNSVICESGCVYKRNRKQLKRERQICNRSEVFEIIWVKWAFKKIKIKIKVDDCTFEYSWECAWEQWFIYNMGKRWNNLIRTIEQKWCRDRIQVTGSLGYTIRESGGIWTVTRNR